VPLNPASEFFLPLWTDFRVSTNPGILDWYTILIALLALFALCLHGLYWVAYRVHSPLDERALEFASKLWWVVAVMTPAATVASFSIRPALLANFALRPWGFLFPLLAAGGFIWARLASSPLRAFLATSLYLFGMMTSAAFGLYPRLLPSPPGAAEDYGLTVYNAAAGAGGLRLGLFWWIPAFLLAMAYTVFVYRRFAGKVEKRIAT
jgi:cytochrome d ubiquinol oxidase subunit II